jgi:phosphoglycerol transferase
MLTIKSSTKSWPFIGLFLLASLFIALLFRNYAGIYPGVLDEFYYNQFSRLLPISESTYGNYLYLLIYRSTNACGNGFLACVYFLNTAFYLVSAFPLWAIARRYCSQSTSVLIISFILLDPFNYWSGFFMPEAPYVLGFWVFIWALLRASDQGGKWPVFLAGCALGLAALVKVHALFLVPASVMYLIYCAWGKQSGYRQILTTVGIFLAGVVLMKLGLGFAIAGLPGLGLFGVYSGMFTQSAKAIGNVTQVGAISAAASNPYAPLAILLREGPSAFWVNVTPIILLFGLPIAATFQVLWPSHWRVKGDLEPNKKLNHDEGAVVIRNKITPLAFLALFQILGLLSVILTFQLVLIVLAMGQVENFWRYYAFALPLLLIFGGASLDALTNRAAQPLQANWVLRSLLAVLILVVLLIGLRHSMGTPWIGMEHKPALYYGTVAVSVLAVLLWIVRPLAGWRVYLWIFIPWVLVISNLGVYKTLKNTRMQPNDSAIGVLINSRLQTSDLEKMLIIQDERSGNHFPQMMENIFFKAPHLAMMQVPINQLEVDLSTLPQEKEWVLLFGNHVLKGEALNLPHQEYLAFGNMTLFGGHGRLNLDFKKADWPGVVWEHEGLFNPPESWGAWSIGENVMLHFKKPLPRKFELLITARAFGPNIGQDFLVGVGPNLTPIRLGAQFSTIKVVIDNPQRLSRLKILVPIPSSPKSLGQGSDERKLGIGIERMQITW